jgi:acetyltransferase-like isoleucine patch superfamily enzyme
MAYLIYRNASLTAVGTAYGTNRGVKGRFKRMNDVFVHSTAIVETPQIGNGTRIWAYTHVMDGATVGANCNIGDHCFIESGATVGRNATIKNGNMLWDGVQLEDGVFLGPRVTFTNDMYPRSPRLPQVKRRYADKGWLRPTVVGQGASIGAGAVILSGITLGEFCMVGAGATVTRNVPPYALVVGSPARLRGWVCQCGLPLTFSDGAASCAECEFAFVNTGESVEVLPTVVPEAV